MIKKNQHILNIINVITDGLIVFLAYLFASCLWLDLMNDDPNNIANLGASSHNSMSTVALIYASSMMLILALLGLYKPARTRRFRQEVVMLLKANLIGILMAAAILYIVRLQEFSRGVLGVFFLSSFCFLGTKRYLLRLALNRMRRKGLNQKHVIVIGTGALAQQYMRSVMSEPELGFLVDGFVGIKRNDKELGTPLLGNMDSLDLLLRNSGIDDVVIALEPDEVEYIRTAIDMCEKHGTKVSIIPFYNDVIPSCPTIDIIGESKIISLRSNPLDNVGFAFLKRTFDVVASLVLLVALSPLLIVSTIGVKLSSPGPVLFSQLRVGMNKKKIHIYKFRSMRVNATENCAWTTSDDPRRTPFGSFMRKFSIDELPQLLNVLKGDMSLVGPRPEIPHFVEEFREIIPLYMVKHQVRPGITGWAQVNGLRGDTSIEERVLHDIWYIEHWSVGLDLEILLRTLLGGWLNDEELHIWKKTGKK